MMTVGEALTNLVFAKITALKVSFPHIWRNDDILEQ